MIGFKAFKWSELNVLDDLYHMLIVPPCVLYLCAPWWRPGPPAPPPSPRRCGRWVGKRRPARGRAPWRWTAARWSPPPPWSIAEGPCCPSSRRSGSLARDRRGGQTGGGRQLGSVWESCLWMSCRVFLFLWPTLKSQGPAGIKDSTTRDGKTAWKHHRTTNTRHWEGAAPETFYLCRCACGALVSYTQSQFTQTDTHTRTLSVWKRPLSRCPWTAVYTACVCFSVSCAVRHVITHTPFNTHTHTLKPLIPDIAFRRPLATHNGSQCENTHIRKHARKCVGVHGGWLSGW